MGGTSIGDNGETTLRRRWCMYSKEDFLPEPSFKSWEAYMKAMGETSMRLKDRITTRSMEDRELNEVRARSHHEMKKNLNWWDLIWFGMGSVIGTGIFVLTGLEAREEAGPAVVLSYAISGISAMLSVFCYTEFAVEIPVAGEGLHSMIASLSIMYVDCRVRCTVELIMHEVYIYTYIFNDFNLRIDSLSPANHRWIIFVPSGGAGRLRRLYCGRQHPP